MQNKSKLFKISSNSKAMTYQCIAILFLCISFINPSHCMQIRTLQNSIITPSIVSHTHFTPQIRQAHWSDNNWKFLLENNKSWHLREFNLISEIMKSRTLTNDDCSSMFPHNFLEYNVASSDKLLPLLKLYINYLLNYYVESSVNLSHFNEFLSSNPKVKSTLQELEDNSVMKPLNLPCSKTYSLYMSLREKQENLEKQFPIEAAKVFDSKRLLLPNIAYSPKKNSLKLNAKMKRGVEVENDLYNMINRYRYSIRQIYYLGKPLKMDKTTLITDDQKDPRTEDEISNNFPIDFACEREETRSRVVSELEKDPNYPLFLALNRHKIEIEYFSGLPIKCELEQIERDLKSAKKNAREARSKGIPLVGTYYAKKREGGYDVTWIDGRKYYSWDVERNGSYY